MRSAFSLAACAQHALALHGMQRHGTTECERERRGECSQQREHSVLGARSKGKMQRHDIIDAIGKDRYERGCVAARTAARYFGLAQADRSAVPEQDVDLAHLIEDIVFESPCEDSRQVDLRSCLINGLPRSEAQTTLRSDSGRSHLTGYTKQRLRSRLIADHELPRASVDAWR